MTSQSEHKSNSDNVRRYYQRHRSLVLVRKILRRANKFGAVPSAKSVVSHSVPMTALATQFAEWCSKSGCTDKLSKQRRKLDKLRATLKNFRPLDTDADPLATGGDLLAGVPSDESGTCVTSAA